MDKEIKLSIDSGLLDICHMGNIFWIDDVETILCVKRFSCVDVICIGDNSHDVSVYNFKDIFDARRFFKLREEMALSSIHLEDYYTEERAIAFRNQDMVREQIIQEMLKWKENAEAVKCPAHNQTKTGDNNGA